MNSYKLIAIAPDDNYLEIGHLKDEMARASRSSLAYIADNLPEEGVESTKTPLDFICVLTQVPEGPLPDPEHAQKESRSKFQRFVDFALGRPKEYATEKGRLLVRRDDRFVVGAGAFGEATAVRGFRKMGGYTISTLSTRLMIEKTQRQAPESPELLLVLREYWFGKLFSDAYKDNLEDSPCPKTHTIEVKQKSANVVKTKLLQSCARGQSLATIIADKSVEIKARIRILYGILSQLKKMHAFHVNHNDLNPANIIVDMEVINDRAATPDDIVYGVKLIDLGRTIYVGTTPGGERDPFRDKIGGARQFLSVTQCENIANAEFNDLNNPINPRPLRPVTVNDELVSFGLLVVNVLSGNLLPSCELIKENRSTFCLKDDISKFQLGYGNGFRPILTRLFSANEADLVSEDELLAYIATLL